MQEILSTILKDIGRPSDSEGTIDTPLSPKTRGSTEDSLVAETRQDVQRLSTLGTSTAP